MREIRTYGSEGGAPGEPGVPTPIEDWAVAYSAAPTLIVIGSV